MKSFLALVAAAFLGGGAALGVGTAIWDDGGTTTVINSPAASDSSLASQTRDRASSETSAGIAGRIYKDAAPGVVQVTSNVVSEDDPVFGQPQQGQSLGSGFVIDKAGHILTNFHVVDGAKEVFVNFSGNDRYKADDRRHRPLDGPGRAPDRRAIPSADATSARKLRRDPGRRAGRGDREPVRPRPHRDRRDRERAPA